MTRKKLLEVRDLKKHYRLAGGSVLRAVDGVSLDVFEGEIVGIVGESGCGKTTCGRTAIGLVPKTGGSSRYLGEDVHAMRGARRRAYCQEVQTIFQDPYASLDPKIRVGDIVGEGLDIHRMCASREERDAEVARLMEQVGLNPAWADHLPREFSGGMRQRICIARALAVKPRLVLCDEPISALDVSIQAQIVNLLMDLREREGLAYLFISHDLSMVRHISDRILVMYLGRVVEEGPAGDIYRNPLHPYTRALISSVPIPDPNVERARKRVLLKGQVPSPVDDVRGCPFGSRCPCAQKRCKEERPGLSAVSEAHRVACWRALEGCL